MTTFSNVQKGLSAALFTAIGLSIISSPSVAADFPQRLAIAERSLKSGVGLSEVPLLRRDPGPGMGVMTEQLVANFGQSGDPITTRGALKTERTETKTSVFGEGWSLQVYADGTRVRYRNYEYLDGANNKPVPLASRMSQEQLEKYGREFIANKLGRYVVLGKNEALVPYFTEFQVGGGGSTLPDAKPVAEEVIANTVIFARSVNGVPILGPGSKIAVIFANDGQPTGFDMDWATYQPTGKTQKVSALTEVQSRARKLFPFDLSASDVKTTRFECGYFDIGARKRDVNAPIQTACLVHANKRQIVDKVAFAADPNSGHTVAAYMGPIPAGATVERDMSWPQALTLLGITPPKSDPPGGTRLR
ncbi:MAG TPA: hypothetical protein VM532_07365 [Burkholderiales bacterium]|nr:hypothetical protein [Burkholderiales bacterium]